MKTIIIISSVYVNLHPRQLANPRSWFQFLQKVTMNLEAVESAIWYVPFPIFGP